MSANSIFITTIYSVIFALFFLALSINVIRVRIKKHVPFGHMDDKELEIAIRAQGNFAEYVPIFLILVLLLDLNQANPFFINVISLTMLVGRFLHTFSLLYFEPKHNHQRVRVSGMLLTFSALAIAAVYNLVLALS